MSYTNGLDKPTDYFNTKLYTGTSASNSITGVGFQPDLVWIKSRSVIRDHVLTDSVRGIASQIHSNTSDAESTYTNDVTSFDSDGFTVLTDSDVNGNTFTYASWNWLAGGTAPAITYSVKVVSDSGNKYRFDDFGTSAVTLDLQEGGTYTFDQSDSSNSGHPLRFSTTSDGTHGGGSEYTTNVTTTGTPGSAGAKTVITVASGTATLYYYCSVHSGMGGQANTNSTFGSSNFNGSIQSTVSANTTAGFSIVNWTGSSSASVQTIGHGLGTTPHWILSKNRGSGSSITAWINYHHKIDASAPEDYTIYLNNSDARVDNPVFGDTAPTSTVFSFNTGTDDQNYISYCFTEKKGFSKFGNYVGNGDADGPYVHLGFRPAMVIIKNTTNSNDWVILDNKRNTFNLTDKTLFPDLNVVEDTTSANMDFLSNGFKIRDTRGADNTSSSVYIYMAFAEAPFVNSNGVPCNAR